MFKQIIIALIYLVDYWMGRAFYISCYLMGKCHRLTSSAKRHLYPTTPFFTELHYLREEVRRLKFANKSMQSELNRIKQKKPCLCKKLEIIYFKLKFDLSSGKIKNYLPISKTSVLIYLQQLQYGLSNLASRIRRYTTSPNRTPVRIAQLIWEMHEDNPHWGRWKIAFAIWRLGIYVSPSTVRNILNTPKPKYQERKKKDERIKLKAIKGKYPNHLWSIDLTTVYVRFQPLYILAIIDHYSRKAMTLVTTFNPTADWTIDNIKKAIEIYGKPKHLISDKGTQFTAGDFKTFVNGEKIHHRYANISNANGNSKVERFFLSLKYEFLNLFLFFSKSKVDSLLKNYLKHYNEYRLHEALDGQTPDEVYFHKPRDKPQKDAKAIKGKVEKIVLGEGLLKAYRLRKPA